MEQCQQNAINLYKTTETETILNPAFRAAVAQSMAKNGMVTVGIVEDVDVGQAKLWNANAADWATWGFDVTNHELGCGQQNAINLYKSAETETILAPSFANNMVLAGLTGSIAPNWLQQSQ